MQKKPSVGTTPPHFRRKRLFSFDLIRAFACLSVIMVHVCAPFVKTASVGSIDYLLGNFFYTISRACVPLFVMISGALMLDEGYSFTKEKWRNHILKMVAFFLFWSVFYSLVFYVLVPLFQHEKIHILNVLWRIAVGHVHLWFIPMIVCLYLLLPLLRLWVKNKNKLFVEYFLILSVVFASIIPTCIKILVSIHPAFESLNRLIDNMYMNYPTGYCSYFILGWYLNNHELLNKKLLYALGILGVCITFIGAYGISVFTKTNNVVFYSFLSPWVFFYSAAIFVFIKASFAHTQYSPSTFHKLVGLLSKHSLGIYAVHMVVRAVVFSLLLRVAPMRALIMIPAVFVATAALSLLATLVIRRIPLIRKFV